MSASEALNLHAWHTVWSRFKIDLSRLLMFYGAKHAIDESKLMTTGLLLSYSNAVLTASEWSQLLRGILTEPTICDQPTKYQLVVFLVRLAIRLEVSPGLFPRYVIPPSIGEETSFAAYYGKIYFRTRHEPL